MDENENYEEYENNNTEENTSSEDASSEDAASSEDGVSREEVIDALREIINENNENDLEGDNLLGDEIAEEDPLSDSEVIDYTEQLNAILTQLENDALARQEREEYESQTIFDKPLNEYTVSEGIIAIGICLVFGAIVVKLVEHFTPQLWK